MQAKIWNHSVYLKITDPTTLKNELEAALVASSFNVLNLVEHHFEPHGYTALWLLGESHLAVHTFPEHGVSYIELSSCMMDKYIVFITKIEELEEAISASILIP